MDRRLYSTYIVASRSRTIYIAVTGDLRMRVFQHKWKEHDGFTEHYNCDRLVWFEHYQEVTKAIARKTVETMGPGQKGDADRTDESGVGGPEQRLV